MPVDCALEQDVVSLKERIVTEVYLAFISLIAACRDRPAVDFNVIFNSQVPGLHVDRPIEPDAVASAERQIAARGFRQTFLCP